LLREANIGVEDGDQETSEEKLLALFARAKEGDETAQTIFDKAGRMFAMGLANLVNIFDPSLIILSGERMQFEYLYEEQVIEQMSRRCESTHGETLCGRKGQQLMRWKG